MPLASRQLTHIHFCIDFYYLLNTQKKKRNTKQMDKRKQKSNFCYEILYYLFKRMQKVSIHFCFTSHFFDNGTLHPKKHSVDEYKEAEENCKDEINIKKKDAKL